MYAKHWPKVHQIKTHFTYYFPKTWPYSLTKVNWTVPYWVFWKLKSISCSHQITFLVSSTFIKILHITHPSSPPFLQVVRVSKRYSFSPIIAWIHTLIIGKNGSVPGVEKHTLSLVFVYGDGFRYSPCRDFSEFTVYKLQKHFSF